MLFLRYFANLFKWRRNDFGILQLTVKQRKYIKEAHDSNTLIQGHAWILLLTRDTLSIQTSPSEGMIPYDDP